MKQTGSPSVLLIGEATHGTHEFYEMRARLTQELIHSRGFRGVVIEADWPDTLRLHRFATDASNDDVLDAMKEFRRFPRWMWRNHEMKSFLVWLQAWNREFPTGLTGIYGMDLYSMHASMDEVIRYTVIMLNRDFL